MKRSTQILSLLAAAAVAAACGRVESRIRNDQQVSITRAWPASGIDQLKVTEINGSISIEAADTKVVSLVATAKGDLERKAGAENQGLFETSLEGGTLRIGRTKHNRHDFQFRFLFGNGDDMRIDYVLKVPASVDLSTSTVNGRITTRGMQGETKAVTVNGTIDVESDGSGELQAATVNGRVKARFTHGFSGAQFKTVNGGVEATLPSSASFDVDLSQVNGDFDASFPLHIHSSPGSRRVSGEVNGGNHRLKIVTVNGDIELRRSNGM